ncbi:Fumarate lyase domain-containing protein [Rozella allomycis CSF55]|uniref:Fumarate lyase domain-containing protein n=1 Tax=Rozella allomycis (strain CSF55) TaxID=988480 RepID=A0A075B3U3_ROZAC|nr:Fumarate lyase domain-containing protein [Rozella allomycis CSF55]|eukprot:EPZ35777.1 Fumarate lyase domain-containing protein [Rozella allomycis CSF55]
MCSDQLFEFVHPLSQRYASREMQSLFSYENKSIIWRKLWYHLAKAQKTLGFNITDEQIAELYENINNIDYQDIKEKEKELRHDVMAHLKSYCDKCPVAAPIIHVGATSCFLTDNADLIIMKKALQLVQDKMVALLHRLSDLALEWRDLTCVGYTHFQKAQPVTIGKRFCLWLQDIFFDFEALTLLILNLPFRGAKGTTGSQASFLAMFENNYDKVEALDNLIAKEFGFSKVFKVCGQTYPRKLDIEVLNRLASFGSSVHKFCNDLRLLSHTKEISEPFQSGQVGSSAMPYKENPILSERCCGLARYLINLSNNAYQNNSVQWLERSLDDSANRRLLIPEAFLLCDSILNILLSFIPNLVINTSVIQNNLKEHLSFFITELIIIDLVNVGKDRQVSHEKIKDHSLKIINQGKDSNLLLEALLTDEYFSPVHEKIKSGSYNDISPLVGTCAEQVIYFVNDIVCPVLLTYKFNNSITAGFQVA